MLMSLDQFVFSLTSAPFRELQRRRTWKHPTSSRVGARDGRQFAGVGDDTITLNGLVAPETFGSIASIRELAAMADTITSSCTLSANANLHDHATERIAIAAVFAMW
ncbi:phage P2 GpU family protein [Burkholderia thailandensis 34]|nr:phage P2 GpU family protein [Burkholderia thailandensis 34]